MNYIWELAIKAKEQKLDEDEIFYRFGQPFSAYMELSFENMNQKDVIFDVEINPYYRFHNIFKYLFDPNIKENEQIVEVIHDLTIQHLKNIDVYMGMNKKEYYIDFVIRDLYDGYFGEYVRKKIDIFTRAEQKIVANNVLNLYLMVESIFLLKNTINKIFTNTYIFSNAAEKDEIIFFLRTKKTTEKEEKLELIKYLFLPFKCDVLIYWEHIFGIFGVDELMKIDSIMNY